MKLNSETNRLFTILTIVYTGLLALSIYLKIDKIPAKPDQYPALEPVVQLLYILLLIYLIKVLVALNEKHTITAFILYTCLSAIYTIDKLFPETKLLSSYLTSVGFLTIVIGIYLLIRLFQIQNKYISLPFILFGFSLIAVFVIEITLIVIFTRSKYPEVVNYARFINLLTPLCILFILKRLGEYIKEESEQGVQSF